MKTIALIDANGIGAKSAFALQDLAMNEVPTGVVYGFLREILTIGIALRTNRLMFCWDSRRSLRRDLFPGYKEKRTDKRTKWEKEVWKVAYDQYDILREKVLPSIGWRNQFHFDGYEADDIMHQAAKQLHQEGHDPVIVSSDEDMYQSLVWADIYNPTKKSFFLPEDFEKKYGITPDKWHLVKAIGGCTSDTVPGVENVGEKTAIAYLKGELKRTTKKFQSIKQAESNGTLELYKRLVTLPFEGFPALKFQGDVFDVDNFVANCEGYELHSLLSRKSYARWEDFLYGVF